MNEISKDERKEKEEDVIWRGKGQGARGTWKVVRWDLCWDRGTIIIHCDRAKGNKVYSTTLPSGALKMSYSHFSYQLDC